MERPPSATGTVGLYQELARLSEATCTRLHEGDDDVLEAAMEQRHALLARIAASSPSPGEVPEISAAIQRVLALDRDLLAQLDAHRQQLRQELAHIAERRLALHSYRGVGSTGAVYVERLT